jgi:hypothetical protein
MFAGRKKHSLTLLITGAMNSLPFIDRGHYKVDYGGLGMSKFKVKGQKEAEN